MAGDITELLNRAHGGDRQAADNVLALLYDELRNIAGAQLRRRAGAQTLQPTGLVNEAYLRLMGRSAGDSWKSRGHFLCFAAKAMRSVLVDHARRRQSEKRGGDRSREPLHEAIAWFTENNIDLLSLDEALTRLGAEDARQRQVVELRFFAGLDNAAVGEAIGTSRATVERDWAAARAWLMRYMDDD